MQKTNSDSVPATNAASAAKTTIGLQIWMAPDMPVARLVNRKDAIV